LASRKDGRVNDDALDHYTQDAPVEVVRRGYDALSWRYRGDDADAEQYKPWIAALIDALDPGSQVIDLGCGCGVPAARDVTAAGHLVTGVDVSEVQIRRARQLVPDATFICADATTVQLPSESYDAAVAL